MTSAAHHAHGHPALDTVRQYVLGRLETELSPDLVYHSVAHTRDEVLPAAMHLAALEGVSGEELLLLQTAALFHDVGFIVQYQQNESIGARLAREVLPAYGYAQGQVTKIQDMIMATALPQSPKSELEGILADADLDVLGNNSFWVRNQDLRNELANYHGTFSDAEWYAGQLKLLQEHRYWTASARSLRDAGKQDHILALTRLVAKCQAISPLG